MESVFNEMLKNDLDIIDKNNLWTGSNLDNFYNTDLYHLQFDNNLIKKLKPRLAKSDMSLAKKIIKRHIIISTIDRYKKTIFYSKTKKNEYPSELLNSINFTKGYIVCFPPEISKHLKKYKYMRKNPRKTPLIITPLNTSTYLDCLDNNNFSSPIWMKDCSLASIPKSELSKYLIYNRYLLEEKYDINPQITALNYLNSIELTTDWEVFNKIKKFADKNNVSDSLVSKNYIKNQIYLINSINDSSEIIENGNSINTSMINSAAVLELIENQLTRFKTFFLDHRSDQRLRFYAYPWPVNYQLSHVVRVCIKFNKGIDIEKVYQNFFNHKLVKKHLYSEKLFLYQQIKITHITEFIATEFEIKININIEENPIKTKMQIEFIIIQLIKLAPKRLENLEQKLAFAIKIYHGFIKSDLTTQWSIWCKTTENKEKKIPYLINLQNSLINAKKQIFETIFWGDASSNAIQLIALRLGISNKNLLMLTNIIDNTLPYENIYSYLTFKIKTNDHSKILMEISHKLNAKELSDLQEDDLNKYLIMPSSYGMGKFGYRKKINEIINKNHNEQIWNKLNNNEKNKISDYFWNTADNYLKDIDFNLNEYKKICKNLWNDEKYDIFIWKTDYKTIISPINFKVSKRKTYLNKINQLKLKKKETLDLKIIDNINKQINMTEYKLKKDEQNFWKRSMITSKNHKIFSRFYHSKNEINTTETKQALVPNSIHAYDSSIINLILNICEDLGIEILVIHDSIGCTALIAPIIKILFKIVNIELLDNATKIAPFPFKEPIKINNKNELYKLIIESKNFFR